MAARAIWKGEIHLARARVPVKLYSAVEERDIRFHLLHDQDMVRVKQRLVNSETGETVEHKDAQKAFEIERGLFVHVSPKELESLEPEPSREIEILRFVTPETLGLQWYARPYYLGPDGDADEYFALAAALGRKGMTGIAKWVMRGKQYVGALDAVDDYLVLSTIRYSDDVIQETELQPPSGRDLEKKERELAEQLLGMLEEEFRPGDYVDEYRDRVLQLIAAKQKGRKLAVRKAVKKPKTKSLEESLRASLKRVQKARA